MAYKPTLKFPGLRVLIAEDNPLNMEILTMMLSHFELIPETATNGDQAIAKAQQSEFDLLILDIHMPIKTGIDVAKSVRDSGLHQPIIVALTASATEQEIESKYFDAYLSKPMELIGLEEVLKKFFSDKSVQKQA